MRNILTLSVLLLAFCIGCPEPPAPPKTPDPPPVDATSEETNGDAAPVVEPEPIVEPPAPVVEPEPVVEPPAPVVEPEPVVEPPAPVIEPEPVVEPPAPVVEPEPVVEPPAPVVEPEPVVEPPAPVVEPEPVVEPPAPVVEPAPVAAIAAVSAGGVPLPPLDDLTTQIDLYIAEIGRALEGLDGSNNYVQDAANVVRDVSGLALLALAVGLADADSKYKPSASHMIAAAKTLAAAQSFDEGQAAFAALQAALENTSEGTPLSWSDKVSDLAPAMKALPNLSSAVKRNTDTERKLNTVLDRQPQRAYPPLAALAVISQGTIPNITQTEKPDAVEEWKKACEEFRDAALKANAAAHLYAQVKAEGGEPDYSVYSASIAALAESCDDCHRIFYPSAVGQTE